MRFNTKAAELKAKLSFAWLFNQCRALDEPADKEKITKFNEKRF